MNPYEPPQSDIQPTPEAEKPRKNRERLVIAIVVTLYATYKAAFGNKLLAVILGALALGVWCEWIWKRRSEK